jgi:hypothetical protein
MLIRTLTPTLSRFAVEGASQSVLFPGVSPSKDSGPQYSLDSPLYREAGEGGGEGRSDSTEPAF